MKLLNTQENVAVLSNVGQVNSFTIKATAKSFRILSDGLYANKIRAIIRELSCNAYDAHVAAGNTDVPFTVHLPTALEPWFSVRDYGIGLDNHQVTNIFTTFFESTKTDSNDFVGALGLGSKSPFSYTENFTVTAIKDGRKGIYTAFINEHGVPSIALMTEEQTTERNGVEVRFSVNDRMDFGRFVEEARNVYMWFDLQPKVTGAAFTPKAIAYETKDIIPGVHHLAGGVVTSTAVMGNIAYPIQFDNIKSHLTAGEMSLLKCGLVMHFGIGELDFQASREGLSYIDVTIQSIVKKLREVSAALSGVLAKQIDVIENKWDRAQFLVEKSSSALWSSAAMHYFKNYYKDGLVDSSTSSWSRSELLQHKKFMFTVDRLERDYNIKLRVFSMSSYSKVARKQSPDWRPLAAANNPGVSASAPEYWSFSPTSDVRFIKNDTRKGVFERAKYHFRTEPNAFGIVRNGQKTNIREVSVYVLDRADSNKPALIEQFLKDVGSPPVNQILEVSSLLEKPSAANVDKTVKIQKYVEKTRYRSYRNEKYYTWDDSQTLDKFDASKTYYYIPLSGFTPLLSKFSDMDDMASMMRRANIPGLDAGLIYGVRKSQIEIVKPKKNWVNLEDHIEKVIRATIKDEDMKLVAAATVADRWYATQATKFISMLDDKAHPLTKIVEMASCKRQSSYSVLDAINLASNLKMPEYKQKYDGYLKEVANIVGAFDSKYPLLRLCPSAKMEQNVCEHIAAYINMVDKMAKTQ